MSRTRTGVVAVLVLGALAGTTRPSAALDLPEALRQVAAANPTLASRSAMVEAARHRVAPAGAWSSPMVEVGVENVPTSGSFTMDPMTMKVIGVTQRLPVFGSNRLARRAAGEDVNREVAAAAMTGYEIFGMTWEAYADAGIAGELVNAAAAHLTVMDRLIQSARARFESGNGRLEDLLRSQAEQGRTLVDLATFRAEQQSARARLDALRGVPPGGAGDTLAPIPEVAATPGADTWLAAVTPDHPRLREMDAQVSRYRFSAQSARRMSWPDLELNASYGRRETLEGGIQQDNMFSATVGFMMPIFARSRERSEGAEMDAMARASEAERRRVELELRQQVTSAHAAAIASERTVTLLADTVIAVQHRAVEASWTSYRAGTTDLWRVFESTHSLYEEEIALLRAHQELARARARLVALTGRGDLLGVALPAPGSER